MLECYELWNAAAEVIKLCWITAVSNLSNEVINSQFTAGLLSAFYSLLPKMLGIDFFEKQSKFMDSDRSAWFSRIIVILKIFTATWLECRIQFRVLKNTFLKNI